MIPKVVQPYAPLIKLGVALALLAAVAVSGWRISAWREGYLAREAAEEEIQAELRCAAGSHCLRRARAAGKRGAAAVAEARQAAQEVAQRAQAARAAQARAETNRLAASAAAAQAGESAWRAKYLAALHRDATCSAWAAGVVPCPVEQ